MELQGIVALLRSKHPPSPGNMEVLGNWRETGEVSVLRAEAVSGMVPSTSSGQC